MDAAGLALTSQTRRGFSPFADCVPMRKQAFFMNASRGDSIALIERSFIGRLLAQFVLFQGL